MMRKTIITICRTAKILETKKKINEISENKGKKNENNSGGISPMILPMWIMWIFKKTRRKSLFHMGLLNYKLRIEQIGKWKKKQKNISMSN